MRCFIAVDLPLEIKNAIADVINASKGHSKGVRWIVPDNMHLTLKFLGEVKESLIAAIKERLSAVCLDHKAFNISITGTGTFPNFRSPNVLWVGIEDSEELKRLYYDIENAMLSVGFEKEKRKFSPHLTIGRVKDKSGIAPALKEFAAFKDKKFGSMNISEFLLMQSVLRPSGAEYSTRSVFRFFTACSGSGNVML
jgi:2'-5' RNA ligase